MAGAQVGRRSRRERSPAPRWSSLAAGWTKPRALVRGRQRAQLARAGKLAPHLLRLGVNVIGCRGEPATMRRAVTLQAPATTRRRRLPLSTSSGRGGTASQDRQAHRLRARSSPAQRSASPCRGGAGRWPFVGPNPAVSGRIRPNAGHLRPHIWLDLQAFRGLSASRTPCFTRERTLVRNQPRPSERCSFAGTSSV